MPAESYERLTQLDNTFLIYEDARESGHMHVAAIQIHEAGPLRTPEGGIDMERIREYVGSRLYLIPRYRQRIERTPIEGHPIWVDDDRFNLFYHVRHTRLPKPGDERMLKRIVGRIISQRLDRGKPLWEMWVIEGLREDRFAIVLKTHHCMVDGISGVDLMTVLMKPEPDATIAPAPVWVPRPQPTPAEIVAGEVRRRAETPIRIARDLWRIVTDDEGARHELEERLLATRRVLSRMAGGSSETPINQAIGPYRRFDWLPVELSRVRAVKRKLGGSVNDVVLATTAGAFRSWLGECRHVDVDSIHFRVMTPVSLRTRSQRGRLGNRVTTWVVDLPIDEPDAEKRLERVREITEYLKESKGALGAETLTQVVEWTGSGFISLTARLADLAAPFNTVVTNIPGPQVPLYLLGARMLHAYPVVPLFGAMGLGIALFSYAGTIYWGVNADWDLVPDLHDFILALDESFCELECAAGIAAPGRKVPGAGPVAAASADAPVPP